VSTPSHFHPDGKRIVSGSSDKSIRVWDAETGEMVSGPFEGHTGSVFLSHFHPDGKRIASGSS
jgi:WD40 repeat protein